MHLFSQEGEPSEVARFIRTRRVSWAHEPRQLVSTCVAQLLSLIVRVMHEANPASSKPATGQPSMKSGSDGHASSSAAISQRKVASFEARRAQGSKIEVSESVGVSDLKVLASLRQDSLAAEVAPNATAGTLQPPQGIQWLCNDTRIARHSLLNSFRTAEALVRKLVLSALHDVEIFRSLGPERLSRLADSFSEANFRRGELIFEQGDEGDQFFIIADGKCSVIRAEPEVERPGKSSEVSVLAVLTDGMFFGERAMLKRQTRYASVRAESTTVRTCYITRQGLEAALGAPLEELIPDRYRLDRRELLGRLRANVHCFDGLQMNQLSALADIMVEEHFVRDDFIIREDEVGDSLYVVLRGTADVLKMGRRIGAISQWSIFGERALMRRERRFAAVKVTSAELSALKVTADKFQEALGATVEELLIEHEYQAA